MYTKLFGSIVNSSIWLEDAETRVLWVTMMALADRKGCVYAAIPGLAKAASIPVKKAKEAISKFLGPDKYSADTVRSPERQGRRIEVIDGGWRLLNAEHYNSITNTEDRARQLREAAKRYRAKKASLETSSNVINGNQNHLTPSSDSSSKVIPQIISSHLNSTDTKPDEKKEGEPAPANGSFEDRVITQWNANKGTYPISRLNGRKLLEASIARGASPKDIESAVWNESGCAGKKIWEVLDPLVPKKDPQDDWTREFHKLMGIK